MKPHLRANLANLARRTLGDGGTLGKMDGHGSEGSGGKGTPSGPSAGPGHDYNSEKHTGDEQNQKPVL